MGCLSRQQRKSQSEINKSFEGKNDKTELHVIWSDLENAYGSVRYQLLEKEIFWIPEDIKNLISTYFKRTYVRFSNNKYSTNRQKLNIGIMMGWVISPLLFALVMERILRSADVNTNQPGPSMKAFMDDVTLIAESRSHMKQLETRLRGLFKWAAVKIKPSKCRSLSLLKWNCKEIKFSVGGNKIPTIREKSGNSLGTGYSLPLTDRHRWQDLRKQLQNGLRSIDKYDHMNNDKIWCIYFGLIPKLAWPMQIYEVSLTKVDTMTRLFCKFIKKWLGVPDSKANVALYSSSTKLKLPTLSLVDEYKLGKARLFQMLRDFHDPLIKNAQSSVITNRKWKAKVTVENAESALRIKEIIGKWKSRSRSTSTAMVVQRIHSKQKKNGVGKNSSWGR